MKRGTKSLAITGPLFKWFGSKWLAAPHYPEPECGTIVEPFAGGAGYSLRYSHKQVHIAEVNPHIFMLWKWLIEEATPDLILSIPLDVPIGTDIRSLGMSLGQSLLLKSWQRTNNVGNCWTISAWGSKPGQWTANTRARVAYEHAAIRHWRIHKCGISLMRSHPFESTWFVDPPYLYNYQYKAALPCSYDDLGTLVAGLPGQVIACEAVCTKTQSAPSYLPFREFRKCVTSRRKQTQSHHSKELIYHKPHHACQDIFALASEEAK